MSYLKVLPKAVQPGLGTTTAMLPGGGRLLPILAQSPPRTDLSSPSRCLPLLLVTMTFDHLEIGSRKSGLVLLLSELGFALFRLRAFEGEEGRQ